MGKSSAYANSLLQLIFWGTAFDNLAQNAAAPLTNLYVALHTADPTVGGNQSSSECNYNNYARVAMTRNLTAWSIAGGVVTPVNPIYFPVSVGITDQTATFFSVGEQASGPGTFLYSAPLVPTIRILANTTPILTAASQITES
jgi:hypothetical protein